MTDSHDEAPAFNLDNLTEAEWRAILKVYAILIRLAKETERDQVSDDQERATDIHDER